MKWEHSEFCQVTGNKLFPAGTLLFLDLTKHRLIAGESPYEGIFAINGIKKMGDFDKSPIGMVLGMDVLENYYKILVGEKIYWINTSATKLASTGRSTTAD